MKYLKVFVLPLIGLLNLNAACTPGGHATGSSFGDATANTTGFTLASVLQNDMVVQQAKPFKLWGTAPAGDAVTITADWNKKAVVVRADAKGKWSGLIPVPAAAPGNFDEHTLGISHKNDTMRLSNILIGEVWLCSGQSNMDMELKAALPWLRGVIDYEKEIASADYPAIRFINIENHFSKQPVTNIKGKWKVCSPQTAGELSGVAYYFGRELAATLQVPVGLVVSSFGGSAAQAWTGRSALEADPALKEKYLDPYDNSPQAAESLDSVKTLEKLFEVLARPSLLYNAMIYPIQNLSIRGFLWYQGESNKQDGSIYTRLSRAMLKGWREDFGQGDLPFYYVQMTPYNWEENDSTATYYARLREAQDAMLEVRNTGMAVTMDIGEVDNIHPRNKKDVGVRLLRIALNQTYNLKHIVYMGPRFKGFEVIHDTVKISFVPQSIGSGLTTTDKKPPRHFYLAGEDKIFHEAAARIVDGHQVWVHSDKVKKPVAVRYAFTNYPVTNFANKENLPAMPFRTDNWDK